MRCPHPVFDTPGTDLVFDIQYFRDKDGQLFPKELAVGSVDKPRRRMLWVVAPPHDADLLSPRIRGMNNWDTASRHGIPWDEDGITLADLYRELSEILQTVGDESRLYAMGPVNARILEEITGRKIINLDHSSFYRRTPKTVQVCSWHRPLCLTYRGSECALRNVKKLQCYLNELPFEILVKS